MQRFTLNGLAPIGTPILLSLAMACSFPAAGPTAWSYNPQTKSCVESSSGRGLTEEECMQQLVAGATAQAAANAPRPTATSTPTRPPRVAAPTTTAVAKIGTQQPRPGGDLLGKWQDDGGNTLEFLPDGTFTNRATSGTYKGNWRFVGPQSLRLEFVGVRIDTATFEVRSISSNEVKLERPDGGSYVLKRLS
jgi:hypothetical protein